MNSDENNVDSELESTLEKWEGSTADMLRMLLDISNNLISLHSPNGRIVYANKAWKSALGSKNIDNDEIFSRIHPDDSERVISDWMNLEKDTDELRDVRSRFLAITGEYITILTNVKKLRIGGEVFFLGISRDITHLEKSRKDLEERTKMLEGVLNAIPDVIGIQDTDRHILRYNQAGYDFLGLKPTEVEGKRCYELIGRSKPCDICSTADVYDTLEPHSHTKFIPEVGLWLDTRAYPVFDSKGQLEFVVEHFRDVTEQKRNEEIIRDSEERFRSLTEKANVLICELNEEGKVLFSNAAFKNILGYSNKEILGESAFDYCHPEQSTILMSRWKEFIEKRMRAETVARFKCQDGSYKWLRLDVNTYTTSRNDTRIVAVGTDIDDEVKAQQALRDSMERFRSLVEASPDWIWEINREGKYIYTSPKVRDLLGIEPGDVIGKNPLELLSPGSRADLEKTMDSLLEYPRIFTGLENTALNNRGEEVVLETSGVPILDGKGSFRGYRGIDRDITQRRKADRELEKMAELQALMTAVSTKFINVSPEETETCIDEALAMLGDFIDADRSYVFIFRENGTRMDNRYEWVKEGVSSEKEKLQDLDPSGFYTINEFIQKGMVFHLPSLELLPKEASADKEEFEREGIRSLLLVPMLQGGRVHGFIGFDSVREERVWSEYTITLLRIVGEIFLNALFRKETLEALRNERNRAEFYLDLLGHDIGNLHQGVYTGIQLSKMLGDSGERRILALESSEQLLERSIKLVKDVLMLSRLRSKEPNLEPIDLNPIMNELEGQFRKIFPNRRITFKIRKPQGPVIVMAEPIISEIFFNLVHNAVKFQQGEKAWVGISIIRNDGSVTIRVDDKGPGIAPESKDIIFERFQSEGARGRTGLGLSIVKALTDRYNGSVALTDRVNGDHTKGTSFIIEIPTEKGS
ncbi:MAG: PAS domain S-box protein [Thermoplasmatota archaeon]